MLSDFQYLSLSRSCLKAISRYTCPKCDCPYCSLSCYKQHGEHCIEMFYNENVVESLKSMKSSKEERVEMQNILWRVKEAEEVQLAQMQQLSEKLDSLDLGR
jgi:biotin synthase-like enzyme